MRKIVMFSLLVLSPLQANIITNFFARGNALSNWLDHYFNGSSTTKFNVTIKALRDSICNAKWALSKVGVGTSCKVERAAYNTPPTQADVDVENLFNSHKEQVAQVRISNELPIEELEYREKRLDRVYNALQSLFPDLTFSSKSSVPTIAICSSGGGFRAMIATLGLYEGMSGQASNPGLLDTVMYTAVLSGSTWVTFPWCVGASLEALKMGFKKYALVPVGTDLKSALSNPLATPQSKKYPQFEHNYFNERQSIQDNVMSAFYWGFPLSMVHVYGFLIAHMTLSPFDDPEILSIYSGRKEPRQEIFLSQAADFMGSNEQAERPIPIGTMVTPLSDFVAKAQNVGSPHYIWGETTPYEFGFDYYGKKTSFKGAYIPTWAMGRTFIQANRTSITGRLKTTFVGGSNDGIYVSKNKAPEPPLGYMLGVFGSAFDVAPHDLVRMMLHPDGAIERGKKGVGQKIYDIFKDLVAKIPAVKAGKQLASFRLFPAELPNFALSKDSPFVGKPTLTWVDGGLAGNLPFYPLLRKQRGVDIIIALDSSETVGSGDKLALSIAQVLAESRGLPFPKITSSALYANAHKRLVTVFDEYDAGQTGPIVVYLPLIDSPETADASFRIAQCIKTDCKTFNFKYSAENIDGLSGHVRTMIQKAFPVIEEQIKRVALMKGATLKEGDGLVEGAIPAVDEQMQPAVVENADSVITQEPQGNATIDNALDKLSIYDQPIDVEMTAPATIEPEAMSTGNVVEDVSENINPVDVTDDTAPVDVNVDDQLVSQEIVAQPNDIRDASVDLATDEDPFMVVPV